MSTLTTFTLCSDIPQRMPISPQECTINSSNDVGTLCKNVVNIGLLTSESRKGVCVIFAAMHKKLGKNWYISPNTSASTGPIFPIFSALVDICTAVINLT